MKRLRSKFLGQALALAVALLSPIAAIAPARAGEKLKIAFFGFEFINTSLERTSGAETLRLAMVGDRLVQLLIESGRYEIAPLSDALKTKIAQSSKITGCNGCQIDWAREAGADLAVWGTVQKVSNLILNENVYMDAVKDGRQFFARSVDIRGNTDQSWEHGIRYLVRYNLIEQR